MNVEQLRKVSASHVALGDKTFIQHYRNSNIQVTNLDFIGASKFLTGYRPTAYDYFNMTNNK